MPYWEDENGRYPYAHPGATYHPGGFNHPMNGFKYKEVGGLAPADIIAMDLGTHFYTNTDGESLTWYQETLEELGGELVKNGQMSGVYIAGVAPSWSYVRGTATEALGISGSAQNITNATGSTGVTTQTIVLDIGVEYEVSFYGKNTLGVGGYVTDFSSTSHAPISVNATYWKKYTIRFTALGDLGVGIYATTDAVADTNGVSIDNYSVRKVDPLVNNNDQYFFGPEAKPELLNYNQPQVAPCLGEILVRVGAAEWIYGDDDTIQTDDNGIKIWEYV